MTAAEHAVVPGGRARAAAGLLLALALLSGGCGLPFPSTLLPPERIPGDTPEGVLSFRGSTGGQPHLLGYELYYIMIGTSQSTPDVRHYEDLRGQFVRLGTTDVERCGSEPLPLVDATDAGSGEHTVSLHMTVSNDSDLYLERSWRRDEPIGVRRGIEDPDDLLDACLEFSATDSYQSGHADITDAAAAAIKAEGLVHLVVYAVSYGRDRGQDLYSDAVLLGTLRLNLFMAE